MKDILHIGYPKTATTWYQKSFYPHIKDIEFIDRDFIIKYFISPNNDEFIKNKTLINDYFNSTDKRVVICEEAFLGSNINATKKFAKRLFEIFPNGEIIITIRNQINILQSSYNQHIKAGGNFSFRKYLFNTRNWSILSKYEYHNTIKLYKDLFGEENVKIYLFEDFLNDQTLFTSNFIKNHLFDTDIEKLSFNKENLSYSTTLSKFVKISNLFTRNLYLKKVNNRKYKNYIFHIPYWHNISKHIFKTINKIFSTKSFKDPKSFMSKKLYNEIFDYYKESNRILIKEYGLEDIKKYNYPL